MSATPLRTALRGRRRAVRAGASAVLSIVVALLLVPAAPAQAATRTFVADKAAWFWMSNSKVITCTGSVAGQDSVCHSQSGVVPIGGATDQTGQVGTTTSPISLGHLGVALRDGAPDMRGYLHFDTSAIPAGSEISKYIIELTVSQPSDEDHVSRHSQIKERPPGTVNGSAAGILACAVKEFWVNSEGDPPQTMIVTRSKPETGSTDDDETKVTTQQNEPTRDCGLNAAGRRSADGSKWTFDITHIAKRWSTLELSDEGIALVPVTENVNRTWTMEFHGAEATKTEGDNEIVTVKKSEAARAIVEYTASTLPPLDPGAGAAPIDTGGGALPPTFDPGTPDGGVVPTTEEPPVQAPPATGPGLTPVASTGTTPWWVYTVLPLAILMFGLVSGGIGADVYSTALGADNRVARLLKQRRLESAGAEG